jgi:hypothetical protein
LDRTERLKLLTQMVHVFTDDAAVLSLYFAPSITAFVAELTGPQVAVPGATVAWDIERWELK